MSSDPGPLWKENLCAVKETGRVIPSNQSQNRSISTTLYSPHMRLSRRSQAGSYPDTSEAGRGPERTERPERPQHPHDGDLVHREGLSQQTQH